MKSRNLTAVGALHPILFFATVYIVALFLSVFICIAIFKSINDRSIGEYAKPAEPATVNVSGVKLPTATMSAVVSLR